MALNWNVAEIVTREGDEYVWPEGQLNGRIECLIWATMFVGMPVIDHTTARDFAARLAQWEGAVGPICTSGKPFTLAEIMQARGLRTNASRITPAKFAKLIAEKHTAKAQRELEAYARQMQEQSQ